MLRQIFVKYMRSWAGIAAVTVLCIIGVLVVRRHGTPAFGWAFLLLGGLCLLYAARVRAVALQYFFICLLSLFLALSGGEFYFHLSQPAKTKSSKTITEDGKQTVWVIDDELLGYKPRAEAKARSVMQSDNTVVYDVGYTTNAESRRVTPSHPQAKKAILFFGCSYTFGEGLNDTENFPYQVAELVGSEYQVYNLGFSGYGPHQFLAMLQSDRLDNLWSRYDRVDVFFLSLEGHELRSGGFSPWDHNGPRFIIENKKAVQKGRFSDQNPWKKRLDKFFSKSAIYKMLFLSARQDDAPLFELQQAILATAADTLKTLYANSTFTLLIWPGNENVGEKLSDKGVTTLNLGLFLPGYAENSAKYQISGDGHPNAFSTAAVADGLVKWLAAQNRMNGQNKF